MRAALAALQAAAPELAAAAAWAWAWASAREQEPVPGVPEWALAGRVALAPGAVAGAVGAPVSDAAAVWASAVRVSAPAAFRLLAVPGGAVRRGGAPGAAGARW